MESSRSKRARTTEQRGQDICGRPTSLENLAPHIIFSRIFPLLPVFSLLQMKLVCKAWHALIHMFREDQTAVNTPRYPSLLILGKSLSRLHLWDKQIGITKIKTPTKNLRDRAGIVLSCNGLLCILTPPENLTWGSEFQVSVYNPLTRRDYILPYLEPISKPVYLHFGFGFRRGINEYKVVGVIGFAGNNNQVVIHDVVVITVSKLGSWRPVVAEKPVCFFEGSSDVVVDGSIHWLCKERADLMYSRVIVSFDLAEEKFQQIATPPVEEISLLSVLAELGGRLVLTVPQITTQCLDIWTMNKDGETILWTKQYVIGPNVYFSMLFIRPVCLLNNGGIVVSDSDKALYVYYPDQRRFEAVATIPLRLRRFKAILYKPVLFSPQ